MSSIIDKIIEKIKVKRSVRYYGRDLYYYKPKYRKDVSNINVLISQLAESYIRTPDIKRTGDPYTNWFKFLVKQKIEHSLSNPPVVNKLFPWDIEDLLDKMTIPASIDGKAWLHVYINDDSNLDWVVVTDEGVIPIYDEYNKYIVNLIRFWVEKVKNDDGEEKEIISVQYWDTVNCMLFKLDSNYKVISKVENRGHFMNTLKELDGETEINPEGFGFIPFIPLYNNGLESDIDDIEGLVVVYNAIATGFVDNIKKFQEAILTLKNLGGLRDEKQFKDFIAKLIDRKILDLGREGEAGFLKVDIPVEARKVLLELLKANMFIMAGGVDPNQDFSGNITNIQIEARYLGLNTKCAAFEKQIRIFYRQLVYIINAFNELSIDSDIKFYRNMLYNKSEYYDFFNKAGGKISNRTLLMNHPLVGEKNVDKELKLIEEEKKVAMENFNKNKGSLDNTSDDNNGE